MGQNAISVPIKDNAKEKLNPKVKKAVVKSASPSKEEDKVANDKKESTIATKSRKRKISPSPDKSQSEEPNKIQVKSDSNKAEQHPGEKESLKIVIRQSDLGSNLKSMEVLGKDLVNTLSPKSKVVENQTITE